MLLILLRDSILDRGYVVEQAFIEWYNGSDKSKLCAQIRASSLAGGMPVW